LLPVVGLGKLSENVIPAITELGQNKSWRIRQCVLEYIPSLSNQLTLEYFSKNLCDLCFGWLTDSVYAVRTAAVINLKKLTQRFGDEFTLQHVLPKVCIATLFFLFALFQFCFRFFVFNCSFLFLYAYFDFESRVR
jgi:hypothetical protein